MSHDLISKVDRGDFQELFIEDLNWLAPDARSPVSVSAEDGRRVEARNVASYNGLRVWVCDERPGSVLEAELDRLIAKTSTDRLVVFDDDTEQVWRWPVRRTKINSVTSRLTSHKHRKGDPDPKFAARLDIIRMPFDAVLDANAVLSKVRHAFDVEAQNESKRASKLMANMYAALEKAYSTSTEAKRRDHEISVTLARILFLMFGDDTEMWQTDAFRNVIQHRTKGDGSDLCAVLNDLFRVPQHCEAGDDPAWFCRLQVRERRHLQRAHLPAATEQGVPRRHPPSLRSRLVRDQPRDLRLHVPVRPRCGDSTRARRALHLRREHPSGLSTPSSSTSFEPSSSTSRNLGKYEADRLRKLRDRLGRIRYLDPACGCGNFVIVAYRELRDLELAVMQRLQEITGDGAMLLANDRPTGSRSITSTASKSMSGRPASPRPPCSSSTDSATSNSPLPLAGLPTDSPSKNRPPSSSETHSRSTGRPSAHPVKTQS